MLKLYKLLYTIYVERTVGCNDDGEMENSGV